MINIPRAVSGGANLVRNSDSTLTRKASGNIRVDAADCSVSLFQAVACSSAVRGGSGGAVERPDAVTAWRWRSTPSSSQVTDAWSQGGSHLPACYGISHWGSHQNAQKQSTNKLKSSHKDSSGRLLLGYS